MNKTKLGLGLGFLFALIVVILIPIIIVTTGSSEKANADATTSPTSTVSKKPYDPNKLTDEEKSRINCFLEEHSRFEVLTEYQCVNVRGCIYKPSEYDKVFA